MSRHLNGKILYPIVKTLFTAEVISGGEAWLTMDRRDFDSAADQGTIGNSVDVVINVEADFRKTAPAKP